MAFAKGGGGLEGLALPPAGLAKIERFLHLLDKWSAVCNLKGNLGIQDLLRDHVEESLVGAPWLLPGELLDLGSGNGFPAVPLLVAREDVRGILLEPRGRRWAFLKEVVRDLGLPARVIRMRVEERLGLRSGNVTVRGLARETWERFLPEMVAEGGRVLWWAGPRASLGPPAGFEDVVTCPLPNPARGRLVIWRRCFT